MSFSFSSFDFLSVGYVYQCFSKEQLLRVVLPETKALETLCDLLLKATHLPLLSLGRNFEVSTIFG